MIVAADGRDPAAACQVNGDHDKRYPDHHDGDQHRQGHKVVSSLAASTAFSDASTIDVYVKGVDQRQPLDAARSMIQWRRKSEIPAEVSSAAAGLRESFER
ncbi:hypothetical protein MesoLjLc_49960 [Mesorhizobium sp. L-8-10]|nr:hypothetical protein MesoLjLb_50060 [Mesorhizobium sp. L-8-3]BCH33066.1 hypothetical protein MesoLjLc_49960 [Mesorhizobium sp. L-8-10]